MKELFFLSVLFLGRVAFSQTITVGGKVTDQNGKPIAFIFISDSRHPYATFSNRNGTFSLTVDPASNLVATANSYLPFSTKIERSDNNIKIVMSADGTGKSENSKTASDNFFAPNINSNDANNYAIRADRANNVTRANRTKILNTISLNQEAQHGSQFLFSNWVHGFAVTPQDSIKQNDLFLFNYDKVNGDLLFTGNNTTAMIAFKKQIMGFTLFDDNAVPYTFEDVPAIDAKHYTQLIASGPKYKLYKKLNTIFIKANFSTNGITSSGNNYDEYKDEKTYYIVKLPGGLPQKAELRNKSIKTIFSSEPGELKKYIAANTSDIDEAYIKNLVDFMNN